MDRVCLSPSKEGCFPGDLLAEPQVEAGATFLEAELPGGWWQVCRVLGNVWDGALVSGHSSSGIRNLTPSSKVPVEGESLQWVSAHDLLVLMVPPGEATTWDPSPFRTTYKRGNQYLSSDQTRQKFPKVTSEAISSVMWPAGVARSHGVRHRFYLAMSKHWRAEVLDQETFCHQRTLDDAGDTSGCHNW